MRTANLNVLDVMSYKYILLDKESLDVIKNNLEKYRSKNSLFVVSHSES